MAFQNQFKTVILLALLTALLLWIGSFWGTNGLIFGLIFALVLNFGSYWFSDKVVLAMYKAKPITKEDNSELYNLVMEVAQMSKIPMPKLYRIPTQNPNAFATGRSPKYAAVAVTDGILDILSKPELRGVIAHEMAHIKNRDTLISTIAATIAGVISYAAMMARWGAIFGGFGGGDRDNNGGIELIALAIITPIIATLLQLAISRSREYLADETGSKNIHDSYSLASALEKLENNHHKLTFGNKTTSSLFIVNPFKGTKFWKLFSTHPPTSERVKKLKSMRW